MTFGFHSLTRQGFPSSWSPTWFWNLFSVGWKGPLCSVFFSSRPSTLTLPSYVHLSGCFMGWGEKSTEAGSFRLQVGRGNCLPSATKVVSLPGLPSHPLFACAVLSFFLSLCRFLLSGSCLPHPKSCAKPFTSWICLGLTNTLWGRYYSKPILQMRKLRWREVPVSCPRSHS